MHHDNTNSSPQCSKQIESTQDNKIDEEIENISTTSKEINSQRLDNGPDNKDENDTMVQTISDVNNKNTILTSRCNSTKSVGKPVITSMTDQPLFIYSNLPSPMSINIPPSSQPLTLFLQALAKLNDSSLSLAIAKNEFNKPLNLNMHSLQENRNTVAAEITPPNSLTCAPPSYSFVLRQTAARRPRLMGTFIPSPSFIQHTPPPNYATAFDIYVDNPIPAPPARVYNFGFAPILTVCPQCGFTGMTIVASKITLCTHLCAIILCLLCCWICAPLPYVLMSCKDVYHYCSNCRNFLGMYCPTNPESVYT